ncbi:hypothetical protein [Agrobacterium vitis]|uniref:hypothetical protein n=1 Tax=Agrobacterium vitis TaxID=373 RepID=UPI0014348A66|nr:hypothetical protein [Agrobacterium vitis]MVA89288.1 hypothetical protein [Agrobacterium vitis]
MKRRMPPFYFQAFPPQSRTAPLQKMLYCRIDCTNPAAKQWLFQKKRRFNQRCGSVSYKNSSVLWHLAEKREPDFEKSDGKIKTNSVVHVQVSARCY